MSLRTAIRALNSLRMRVANQAGQAMVEYSTFTWAILLAGGLGLTVIPVPDGNGGTGSYPFLISFLKALQLYLNSVYYWIDMPLP
jgi:hypothetical protein